MPILKLAEATLLGVIIGIFPDWFFGGILFHSKYLVHPEIWRPSSNKNDESLRVIWSILLSVLTFGGFMFLYSILHIHTWIATLELAVAIWLIGPLPLLLTNALFVKTHPAIVFSHSAGWLAKLLVASLSARLIL